MTLTAKRTFARPLCSIASIAALCAAALFTAPALADGHTDSEAAETVITSDMTLPAGEEWKHSFDAYKAEAGAKNRALGTALRFAEAMEAEGFGADQVKVAIVIHGPSVFDVANDARYGEKHDTGYTENDTNPSRELVADLIARGAEIWVCGVAAKYHKVGNADLLPGVKMAPSGTVAHAELQRRGFGINPY